jgi:hypothetical protein
MAAKFKIEVNTEDTGTVAKSHNLLNKPKVP